METSIPHSGLMPGIDDPGVKAFRGGTDRLVAPEETLARVSKLMPAMGITRLANVTGLDRIGIPVAVACRPNSRALSLSQGKGLSLAAARASALMEATESFHAERITLPLKYASCEELGADQRLVDVTRLPRTAAKVFDDRQPLHWIEGHELFRGVATWVPHEMVSSDYRVPYPADSGYFLASSNGLASGNHLLEAASHGICEVVERDAATLWRLAADAAKRATRIDPVTVDDPRCCEALERFDRAGVDVGIWETTSDVPIPSFICTIVERSDDLLRRLYAAEGMGCHPRREVALLRALTEAAQSRVTMIAGSRDDIGRAEYEHLRDLETLRRQRTLLNLPGPMRSFLEAPTFDADTFAEDVFWELDCLGAAGISEVVVVDLSKLALGVPVVQVIVPGLENMVVAGDHLPGARARAVGREDA